MHLVNFKYCKAEHQLKIKAAFTRTTLRLMWQHES